MQQETIGIPPRPDASGRREPPGAKKYNRLIGPYGYRDNFLLAAFLCEKSVTSLPDSLR